MSAERGERLRRDGPEADFDPDRVHSYPASWYGRAGWHAIPPAGVNLEFDGIEYEDTSIPEDA